MVDLQVNYAERTRSAVVILLYVMCDYFVLAMNLDLDGHCCHKYCSFHLAD